MDVLDIVYQKLIKDDFIRLQTLIEDDEYRIKYYEYPETGGVEKPFIIIDPLDTPMPDDFADNIPLTVDFLIQIDVWSLNRLDTLHLANKISEVLTEHLGCGEIPGPNEYDKDTGIFRIGKRYRGKMYRENII